MVDFVIFSLIYGPVAVTLVCWLVFSIEARRENKRAVVRILGHDRRRLSE